MIITYDDNTLFITIGETKNLSCEDIKTMIKHAKKETDAYDMDAVVIKKEHQGEDVRYSYLCSKGNEVVERYLYNPEVFNHFKKKDQCENLWHGCETPSVERIYEFAKTYKAQETV